ncbi:MAG: aconitate hydratase [Candidatus Ornithospirochaeta sp.]|nr:aconitate hydratase [Candidatus Ornithospirochaeta sp.]
MGKSLAYRILEDHLVSGTLRKGESISVRIDQTLTQDATGTMAYLEFESLGIDRVRNELAVSYVDHNTVQVGFENFDDHEYLRTVADRHGIIYSRAGNGICHQVHLERFARPGATLLGSDSHTPTAGGIASFAVGAGGLDVALAMAGIPFSLIAPKVVNIRLHGRLRPFVSAKDVILHVLSRFGVKGNVNSVFEYTGDGVRTLSVPERSTIANMGAECGVTTSLFPSDERTREFLIQEGREKDFVPLEADEDAEYDEVFEIDLDKLEPLCACPHSPGNIKAVSQMGRIPVNQVLIGSCTNSSLYDLRKAAAILDGHHVSDSVSLGVAPGSRAVLMMITEDGTLEKLLKAGARILESACGFCIGNHQSPGTDAVSLRTNNRNFEGRSGTKSAQVYLVSPETAAASAITGFFTDPREMDADIGSVSVPSSFIIDDSMFIRPTFSLDVKRGPNIGKPPKNDELPSAIEGVAAIKVGDKITTDHIMPAGARMKYRSNIEEYSKYVFEPVDPGFHDKALSLRKEGKASFIIAGASYGQGSSREHAAICPMHLGVKAVIAVSIERIHQANLCNFGILPLVFSDPEDYSRIDEGDELAIEDAYQALESGKFTVIDRTKGICIKADLFASEEQKAYLKAGGRLNEVTRCVK